MQIYEKLLYLDNCLGYVDHKVSHVLELVDHVYVVDSGEITVGVVLQIEQVLFLEVVAVFVYFLLHILGVGDVRDVLVSEFQVLLHHVKSLEDKVHHKAQAGNHILVEGSVVDIPPLQDSSDVEAAVSDAFQLTDNLEHRLYPAGGLF